MEIRNSDEAKRNIEDFTKRFINLLKDKDGIMDDIKALKQEFKEEGVPVGLVAKVINLIKAQKKKTQSEICEEEIIKGWLESNIEIDSDIGELAAK